MPEGVEAAVCVRITWHSFSLFEIKCFPHNLQAEVASEVAAVGFRRDIGNLQADNTHLEPGN